MQKPNVANKGSSFIKILVVSSTTPTAEHIEKFKKRYGPNIQVTHTSIVFKDLSSLLEYASLQQIFAFIRLEDIPKGITDPIKNEKKVIIYDGEWKVYKEETKKQLKKRVLLVCERSFLYNQSLMDDLDKLYGEDNNSCYISCTDPIIHKSVKGITGLAKYNKCDIVAMAMRILSPGSELENSKLLKELVENNYGFLVIRPQCNKKGETYWEQIKSVSIETKKFFKPKGKRYCIKTGEGKVYITICSQSL